MPTTSDPLYEKPIHLTGPTILRAKAFKPGFTKSITAQAIYLVGRLRPGFWSEGVELFVERGGHFNANAGRLSYFVSLCALDLEAA